MRYSKLSTGAPFTLCTSVCGVYTTVPSSPTLTIVPLTGPVTMVGMESKSPSGSLSFALTLKVPVVFSGTVTWSFTATGGLLAIGLSASSVVTTTMAVVHS